MNNGKIDYPEIDFWNKKAEGLIFVNPEDFRRERLLSVLGLNNVSFGDISRSFGIADRDEIIKRQKMMRFFIENPDFVDFLRKISLGVTQLPTSGQHFLDYFSPESKHNPFWNLVYNFVDAIEQYQDVPVEIVSLTEFLKRTSANLEAEEGEMAEKIAQEIQRAVYIEGVIKYSLKYNRLWKGISEDEIKGSEAHGYQKYAYGYRTLRVVPGWAEKNVCKWTGVKHLAKLYIAGINTSIKRRYFSPYIIRKIPEVISKTVTDFLSMKIKKIVLPEPPKDVGVSFSVFFRYSEQGLEVGLLNVDAWREQKYKPVSSDLIEYDKETFPGYSRLELRTMKSRNRSFKSSVNTLKIRYFESDIANRMKEKVFDGGNTILISAREVDDEYKWVSLPTLYKQPSFETSYKTVQKYRAYVRGQLETLKVIAQLARVFGEKAREWNKPLCFPEILEDHEHLVSFEALEPIHLIGERKPHSDERLTAKDLIPIISISPLNGQLIGFTGQNAGGKSATEEAIVNALFLAQSGLPVFGKNFSLNVKRKLGMVFLERGSGSTLELLLRKTKNILESLNGTSKNGVVLVLDEVGTGTQEIDGFAYGKKLLIKLAGAQCSIIFSTQITDLAKYAQENLGAECFSFNLQHEIKPGIGRGGVENLMAEIGVDELLK
jgi:hypothetical protein